MNVHLVPTVSIVVPCFDVAPFVDECVGSVAEQTHAAVQIVLVNDGSTDSSASLIDRWAERDSRVVVIHQENGGLGAARNAGVAASTGDYLFFLDGDDVLPVDAIARMVSSAESSGSDVVSGVAIRFDEEGEWRSDLYASVFDVSKTGTHIFNEPTLVRDQMACSKLFRRTFWDACAFRFPTGVLFEDVRLVMEAHCRAATVDLLAEPTYRWRRRDNSITQDRMRPGSVTERFNAVRSVDAYLQDSAPRAVWKAHGTKVYDVEVRLYGRLIAEGTEAYSAEFLQAAGPVLARLQPDLVAQLNPVMLQMRQYVIDGDSIGAAACAATFSDSDGRPVKRALRGALALVMHDPRVAFGLAATILGSAMQRVVRQAAAPFRAVWSQRR